MITHPMRAPIDLDQSGPEIPFRALSGRPDPAGQTPPTGVAAGPGALI